ncbi:lipase member H-B-like isoform X1 [Daktulosphaira vitifoliae]|uniref:lipase member H-B-like isoform X1 n=1 Tax=Daktulosphaira vitifoliae TaxID=58002 RepID=UPI0021A9C0B0|nr:lipase member H-B-like isoform X1 [Daktulosphaira vitifoliae]
MIGFYIILFTLHSSKGQIISKLTQHNLDDFRNNAVKSFFLTPKALIVDNTRLEFSYWNYELGNNYPIPFEYGKEQDLIKYWIPKQPLKIITHGWLATSENSTGVFAIKTAYVNTTKYNVISVDWSAVGGNVVYPIPAYLTTRVGGVIAKLLENLVQLEYIKPTNIHLIGHSLGAHVSGACGAAFTLGKIGRITGLDPAGPGFEYGQIRPNRLDKTDALFVDVLHTAGGVAGFYKSIGHADFYPNGGSPPQPGCYEGLSEMLKIAGCSHARSHQLYADSIYHMNSMIATQCSSWSYYESGGCNNNTKSFLGHSASTSAFGNFYLKTKSSAPFGTESSVLELNSGTNYTIITENVI